MPNLARLLETADVLVENFKDQSLGRMGVGPQTLRTRFPKLIVAANKGFLRGPYANRTAMDEVVQMMTGLAYMTGPSGRPLRVGSSANDMMAGLFGAMAVVAALMERETTQRGREIRIGLFENCLFLVGQHMVQFDIEGVVSPPMPERRFSWPVYDIFETRDEAQMFVAAVTGGHWTALCDVLGLDEMGDNPELATPMARIRGRSSGSRPRLPRGRPQRWQPSLRRAISRFRQSTGPQTCTQTRMCRGQTS